MTQAIDPFGTCREIKDADGEARSVTVVYIGQTGLTVRADGGRRTAPIEATFEKNTQGGQAGDVKFAASRE